MHPNPLPGGLRALRELAADLLAEFKGVHFAAGREGRRRSQKSGLEGGRQKVRYEGGKGGWGRNFVHCF